MAQATPCSHRPENKVRPYFSAKDGHKVGCDVEGEVELVKRARKQRISTRDGFSGSFPNRLVLRNTRTEAGANEAPASVTGTGDRRTVADDVCDERRNRHWAAQTIRPICRTFINYPYDRDLRLTVPGISADTYLWVFQRIKSDDIILHPDLRIFYAPISWKKSSANNDNLEILLSAGEWQEKLLARPYRVKVDWQKWGAAKRNYVSREIEIARQEYIAAKGRKSNEKGWLFFIGRQDESDHALFHVEDHRLICCLVAEMIYPS